MGLLERSRLSLKDAAAYVATRCGVTVDEAQEALRHAFVDGDLRASGLRQRYRGDDEMVWPELNHWRKATIDWEKSNVTWRNSSAIAPTHLHDVRIDRVQLDWWLKRAARERAQVDASTAGPAPSGPASLPDIKSGAPGRPTPIHLVTAEHQRRIAAGTAKPSVVEESKDLSQWWESRRGDFPPLKPKGIENHVREAHRAWRAAKPKNPT